MLHINFMKWWFRR